MSVIGYGAFCSCSNLNEVYIGAGVTEIGAKAFYNCNLLTTIDVYHNECLTTIGEEAFMRTRIFTMRLPATVTSIGDRAYYGCTALDGVAFHGAPPAQFGSEVFDSTSSDFHIICHVEYFFDWCPNGETEWNGYPLVVNSNQMPNGMTVTGCEGGVVRSYYWSHGDQLILVWQADEGCECTEIRINGVTVAVGPSSPYLIENVSQYAARDGEISIEVVFAPSAPEIVIGDADGNGILNFSDVASLYIAILSGDDISPALQQACDVNGDGTVSFADISTLYIMILFGEES